MKYEGIPEGFIHQYERDVRLDLHNKSWPSFDVKGWSIYKDEKALTSYLGRTFPVKVSGKFPSATQQDERTELFEAMIRFPSAPIYGIRREKVHPYAVPRIHFHTMRLICGIGQDESPTRIKRIFIFNNGLNECADMDFYYQLAAHLVCDKETACLIRPIPGHLNRYPFSSDFTARPLDTFLDDASDLFRQYVRYMLESQWLLSILSPLRTYRVIPGTPLLAEGDEDNEGRFNAKTLAGEIFSSWRAAYKANPEWVEDEAEKNRSDGGKVFDEIEEADVEKSVNTLRVLLGWKPYYENPKEGFPIPPPDLASEPPWPNLHMVGYSLGGFMAQSAFYSWPFAVSSCTTLCSGGALRDVAITAFANPEEWQMIIRALRYEMIKAFANDKRTIKGGGRKGLSHIAGIPLHLFKDFEKTFYDVFLQDNRGTYQSRVSEFVNRLFFVTGGNDPIVSPSSVQDASPPGGINMLEIAGLEHFVWHPRMKGERKEWRNFWLPEVARILGSFASRAEEIHLQTLANNWFDAGFTKCLSQSAKEREKSGEKYGMAKLKDIYLSSSEFQSEFDGMIRAHKEDGSQILIFRNEAPAVLLDNSMLWKRSLAVHYSDEQICEYFEKLRDWNNLLTKNKKRLLLVVSGSWLASFRNGEYSALRRLLEAGAVNLVKSERKEIWKAFQSRWDHNANVLMAFDPYSDFNKIHGQEKLEGRIKEQLLLSDHERLVINCLPDSWVFFSQKAVEEIGGKNASRERLVVGLMDILFDLNYSGKGRKMLELKNEEMNALGTLLKNGDIRIIRFSHADFNPRHRGSKVQRVETATNLLTHCMLALARSVPYKEHELFKQSFKAVVGKRAQPLIISQNS